MEISLAYRYQESKSSTGSFEKYTVSLAHPLTTFALEKADEVLIESADHDYYIIPRKIANYSKWIQGISNPCGALHSKDLQKVAHVLIGSANLSVPWPTTVLPLDFVSSDVLDVVIQYMFYRDKYMSKYTSVTYIPTPSDAFGMPPMSPPLMSNLAESQRYDMEEVIPQFKIPPTLTTDVLLAADILEI
jgi:hypothetical protein